MAKTKGKGAGGGEGERGWERGRGEDRPLVGKKIN